MSGTRPDGTGATAVLVTGAGGLLGTPLVSRLHAAGRRVLRLVRRDPRAADEIALDPARGTFADGALDGVGAVVHLAGEPVPGRWTAEKRRRIVESRSAATARLCEALAALPAPPGTLVAASAVGFYGDRGDELLDETSGAGTGFLAEVATAWEAACAPAARAGIRVVNLRFGMVLARRGGALEPLLAVFRLGLGGKFGNGRQWMSWIALEDALAAIEWALETPALRGPINTVAPGMVRNREFARTLGRVLGRPALFPAPAFAMRVLLGPMADELLLASQRAVPRRLSESGFRFRTPELEATLRRLLGREVLTA